MDTRFYKRILTLLILVWISVLWAACAPSPPKEITGIAYRSDILVVFKFEATDAQIEYFVQNVLSKPDRGGYSLESGIIEISFIELYGHQGYTIMFSPAATQSQREAIRTKLQQSPIVLKILENVIPINVKESDLSAHLKMDGSPWPPVTDVFVVAESTASLVASYLKHYDLLPASYE